MTDLDAVTVDEPLWTLQKDGHSAEARVRAISVCGPELRFNIDGELYYSDSRVGTAREAAREKRRDFEKRDGAHESRTAKANAVSACPASDLQSHKP